MVPKKKNLENQLRDHDVQLTDGNRVTWKPHSHDHPQNWSARPKCYTVVIVIWLEFYMTVLSSSGAATAKAATSDYEISDELAVFSFISVHVLSHPLIDHADVPRYLLGQTIGGILCSPLSEFFGRKTIYVVASGSFAVSSAIVAVPNHVAGIFVGRFFQGIFAAVPATVAFGNFSDLFDAEMRIWIVYAYTLIGMSGLAVGPIFSSYITMKLTWRWVFYIAAVIAGLSACAACLIKESNSSRLLTKKTRQIQKQVGGCNLEPDVDNSKEGNLVQTFFKTHVHRPITFVVTEPLITLCAVLCAIAFGLIYGLTESLTIVYTTPPFDTTFNETSASLSFIAILIGFALNIIPRFYDIWYLRRQRRLKRYILPETKIHSFVVACPLLAIGLWIFAWTIPTRITDVPWPVSMLGLVFVGFSANDFSHVLFGYITDSYGFHAASAVAVLSSARTLAAAAFPLFAKQMYKGLGNNYATTVLATVATIFCFSPYVFLHYGSRLRKRSRWASSGDDVLKDENKHMRQYSNENHESECDNDDVELWRHD